VGDFFLAKSPLKMPLGFRMAEENYTWRCGF